MNTTGRVRAIGSHSSRSAADRGFTLVEILIVIVILGILATVTVFAVRGITDKGESASCQTEANTVVTAAEAYYAENSSTVTTSLQTLLDAGYLRDDVALGVWTLTDNSANPGAVVTLVPVAGGRCDL